jgi:endonuclease/exonuclease/phosphatase family metal-dependent hydrolase
MTYNVLWGGGLDRRFDANLLQWQRPLFTGRNRFPDIVELLRGQTPDVLGIQEAAGWDDGRSPLAAEVARRLDMAYSLASNDYEINTALYSRFPITATLDLTPYMSSNSALVAVLQTPDGQPLIVAVAHLDPFTSRMRSCQVDLILSVLQPLAGYRTLLLGDMNFRPNSGEFRKLLDAGWEALAIETTLPIDYIFTRTGVGTTSTQLWPAEAGLGVVDGQRLSDHYPLGALVKFADRDELAPAPELSPPSSRCSAD